jgi:hypothetical protein
MRYKLDIGPDEIGGLMAVIEKDGLKDHPLFENIYKQLKDMVETMLWRK